MSGPRPRPASAAARSQQARVAAFESWAVTVDRASRTATARAGLDAKFTREARERLGPGASDRQVADAAESARKAHYAKLSKAGVAARGARVKESDSLTLAGERGGQR